MSMEVPVRWAREAVALPRETVAAGMALPSLKRIVADAVHATGCAAAIVCRQCNGQLAILAGTEDGPLKGVVPVVLNADTARHSGAISAQFIDTAPALPIGFHADASVRFAAAARVACEDDVFLIVLHDEDRAPLSAAQTYVLRAHAAHLATMFELAHLRERVGFVDGTAHQARVERLRLLESVAIHARDSIIITEAEPIDLPGPRILYCNDAFTRATGYSAAEMFGQTPRMLQGPKTDPAARARLRKALAAWEPVEIEMINYRKNGTEFWVELSIVPVADERGWFTHWVSVQRDITERKNAEHLADRVRIAEFENMALASEIQERKRVEAELLYTAFHDNLTRLRNRAFFMERLTAALKRVRDENVAACSVLFIDLDQFKIVNDSLGHIAGDALLKEIAHRLKACVRPHNTLARIGGDEFAILIEDAVDLSTPVHVAECIIEALRAPVQLGRQSVFPSCSIGIVQSADRAALPEDLIRDADIAMYVAKRGGFGDYAIFDASMHDSAVARLTLQTDLRQAVDHSEFHLAYQPIVDPANGSVFGFEALLRWQHAERGTIAPSEFVPVAEELGLIRQIDRRVMREGCAQLSEWQRRFSNPALRMSLNTSAAEFVDPDFIGDLKAILTEFGLEPHCVELEITEGIFLHPSPGVEATIAAARQLGVRIALDDFGTGYSSLSYINRYAIDTIKIDKSFIDSVCTDRRTRAIVELIVKLGSTLDLKVVAEGVETQEQADVLRRIGCGAVQGYHFARPLSVNAATELLRSIDQAHRRSLLSHSSGKATR